MKRGIDFIHFFLLVSAAYLLRGFLYNLPDWYDILLFLPFVRQWAFTEHVTLEPDLILAGGEQAPFYLYRFYAFLLHHGAPETLLLESSFFLSFLLYAVFLRHIGFILLKDKVLSLYVTIAGLLLPGSFMTLNWQIIPFTAPVSGAWGYALALFQITYALQGRWAFSGMLGFCNGFIHPAYALIGACCSAITWFSEAWAYRTWQRIGPMSIALFLTVSGTAAATLLSPNLKSFDTIKYFENARLFSHHLYPQPHIRDGWGICFLILILATYLCRIYLQQFYRTWISLFCAATCLFVVSLANCLFELSPHFSLLYVGRTFTLLEPFVLVILVASLATTVRFNQYKVTIGILISCIGASLNGEYTSVFADAYLAPLCICGVALMLLQHATPKHIVCTGLLLTVIALNFLSVGTASIPSVWPSLIVMSAATCAYLYLIRTLSEPSFPEEFTQKALSAYHPALVTALSVSIIIGALSIPFFKERLTQQINPPCDSKLQPFYTWVRENTSIDATFIFQPNFIAAYPFRVCTGRKLFIALPDINQLAYSPLYYQEGIDRLSKLGMEVTGERTTIWFDYLSFSKYPQAIHQILTSPVREISAEYAVVRSHETYTDAGLKPFYTDDIVAVYKISEKHAPQ